MGDTELESVTSTMSTSKRSVIHQPNCGKNREAAEVLHQWLHQMAGRENRDSVDMLVEAILEEFGADGLDRLLGQLMRRIYSAERSEGSQGLT